MNTPTMSIPLDQIEIGERLRAVDDDYAALIAETLTQRGLDTPIIVALSEFQGLYRLIAGGHRVAAARIAGWTEIPAKVVEVDELQAKLIEIDENLIRRELSALDRAVFLAERKAIYEALNPEAAHGKARKSKGSEKTTSLSSFSFGKATAQKLGVDERTIQRAVARAAIVPEARAMNELVAVDDPYAMIAGDMLISSVTYSYDEQGSGTGMRLVGPEAYDLLPEGNRQRARQRAGDSRAEPLNANPVAVPPPPGQRGRSR